MYWFSCRYLKYLYRQHRHSCTCCQWRPGLYCAITASQNDCTLTHHGLSVKQRCQLEMPSIHSEDRKYLLPEVSQQELTDQPATSALREVVAFASIAVFQPCSQRWVKRKQCSCLTGALHVTHELFIAAGNASRKVPASYLPSSQLSHPYCLANTSIPREAKQRNSRRREASLG